MNLANGPGISDIDPNQIIIFILGLIGTAIASAWRKDHRDAKRSPITVEEKVQADIASGDKDVSIALQLAAEAKSESAAAKREASEAKDHAEAAKAETRVLRGQVDAIRDSYHQVVGVMRWVVTNWSTIREDEYPPERIRRTLAEHPFTASVTRPAERGDATSDRD